LSYSHRGSSIIARQVTGHWSRVTGFRNQGLALET